MTTTLTVSTSDWIWLSWIVSNASDGAGGKVRGRGRPKKRASVGVIEPQASSSAITNSPGIYSELSCHMYVTFTQPSVL